MALWRVRLPAPWADVQQWTTLTARRQFVYDLVSAAYKPLEAQSVSVAHVGHHEVMMCAREG
jgi:hypothetical protein